MGYARVTIALAVAAACAATSPGAQTLPPMPGATGAEAAAPLPEESGALLDLLATEADPVEAGRLAREVEERWSHSGSAAMDLLLRRGKDAIEAGAHDRAVVHLTALTDHAPDFAEGWAARATAFFLQEEWGLALSDIEQTLILEPRHYGALFGLCVIMRELERPDLALRACRASRDVYPAQEEVGRLIETLEQETGGRAL